MKKFVLISSATIYGEAKTLPTPEDYAPLKPISLYAASKLAGEALLSSHSSFYGFAGISFRFANVIGPRSTHGVIRDFIAKLRKDSKRLEILGDGKQTKSFFHVSDCVAGLLHDVPVAVGDHEAFNLGSTDTIAVTQIADIVCRAMGLRGVEYAYTGGDRGWRGDIPKYWITIEKARKLGWKPTMNSSQAVEATVKSLLEEA